MFFLESVEKRLYITIKIVNVKKGLTGLFKIVLTLKVRIRYTAQTYNLLTAL